LRDARCELQARFSVVSGRAGHSERQVLQRNRRFEMSVVCAAKKDGAIAISADTQTNSGSLVSSVEHVVSCNKLFPVNGSIIGIVGWTAIADMVEHAIIEDQSLFQLGSRIEIFGTVLRLHEKLKEVYKIETNEDDDQPGESIQLQAMIVNRTGVFEISSYRSVTEYQTYWAIGSGCRLALGAMHALYQSKATAKQIVEGGVRAAAEFDDSCGLPLRTRIIRVKK
jgi:ATP-dependent HslUV protease subunit HslV